VIRKGGTDGDPVLRGLADSRLGVLLDGELVLGGCGNRMDTPTAYAYPGAYDRITVLKGPQSVLHGPGNAAGVVLFDREISRTRSRASTSMHRRWSAVSDATTLSQTSRRALLPATCSSRRRDPPRVTARTAAARPYTRAASDRVSFGALTHFVAAQTRYALYQGNIVGQHLGPAPSFAVFSLNGGWRMAGFASLSAGVDNLFDTTYAEFISRTGSAVPGLVTTTRVNEPGRALWVKLDLRR
jgi:outer membrane receptor protein involved in Fe transport